jgi:hypothetical protein
MTEYFRLKNLKEENLEQEFQFFLKSSWDIFTSGTREMILHKQLKRLPSGF